MSGRDADAAATGTALHAIRPDGDTLSFGFMGHYAATIRREEEALRTRLEAPLTHYSSDRQQDEGRQQ